MRKFNSKRSNNLTGIGGEYLSEPGQQKAPAFTDDF